MAHRSLCLFLLLLVSAISVFAQTDERNKSSSESSGAAAPATTSTRANAINPKYTTPKSALNTAYGAKIAEYTTEKYFMTELVDRPPAGGHGAAPERLLRSAGRR